MHSRSHAIMLASKAFYVFGFTFFRNPKSDGNAWFLSLLLFFGSAIVFASFYYDRPYYHSKSQQVSSKTSNYIGSQYNQWILSLDQRSPSLFLCHYVPRLQWQSDSLSLGFTFHLHHYFGPQRR